MDVIRLKSSDGHIFDTTKDIVKCSRLIQKLLENCENVDDQNSPADIVPLPKVTSEILVKILVWAEHHQDDDLAMMNDMRDEEYTLCAWDKEFLQLDQRILFDIIMAANYLDIKQLLLATCRTVANVMTNKTPNQIRDIFNIPNDFQ